MKYKNRFEAKDSFLSAWHFAIPEESMFADRVLLRLWLVVIVTRLCVTELAFLLVSTACSGWSQCTSSYVTLWHLNSKGMYGHLPGDGHSVLNIEQRATSQA